MSVLLCGKRFLFALVLGSAALLLVPVPSSGVRQKPVFRAGAHAQNINPKKYPVSVNGGMSDRQAKGAHESVIAAWQAPTPSHVRASISVVAPAGHVAGAHVVPAA